MSTAVFLSICMKRKESSESNQFKKKTKFLESVIIIKYKYKMDKQNKMCTYNNNNSKKYGYNLDLGL